MSFAPHTPRKGRRSNPELPTAESIFPVLAVHPRGIKRKQIDYEKLREEMAKKNEPPKTPPPRPLASTIPSSWGKKKDPTDVCFIKRKPSVYASPSTATESMRSVSTPQRCPASPSPSKIRRVISGPAPGLRYYTVAQLPVFPPGIVVENPPIYPADDNVILGVDPDLGCIVAGDEAVSRARLNISSPAIVLAFHWKAYEQIVGPYRFRVHVTDFRSDPFKTRLKILEQIRSRFEQFKDDVKRLRDRMEKEPEPDVWAYSSSDIRVTMLQRRYGDLYQVKFIYPGLRR